MPYTLPDQLTGGSIAAPIIDPTDPTPRDKYGNILKSSNIAGRLADGTIMYGAGGPQTMDQARAASSSDADFFDYSKGTNADGTPATDDARIFGHASDIGTQLLNPRGVSLTDGPFGGPGGPNAGGIAGGGVGYGPGTGNPNAPIENAPPPLIASAQSSPASKSTTDSSGTTSTVVPASSDSGGDKSVITSLMGLVAAQYASAGVRGGDSGYSGLVTGPISDTVDPSQSATVSAPSSPAPNKRLIVIVVIAIAGIAIWYFKFRKG